MYNAGSDHFSSPTSPISSAWFSLTVASLAKNINKIQDSNKSDEVKLKRAGKLSQRLDEVILFPDKPLVALELMELVKEVNLLR